MIIIRTFLYSNIYESFWLQNWLLNWGKEKGTGQLFFLSKFYSSMLTPISEYIILLHTFLFYSILGVIYPRE
jgi:hypothetical protein